MSNPYIVPREVVVEIGVDIVGVRKNIQPTSDVFKFANAIADYVRANPEWIKCSERMPAIDGYYLVALKVAIGHEISITSFDKKTNDWWANTRLVTHWMHLPTAPKGD